jgi:hypothetical protein
MRIQDPGWKQFGSGMEKSRIRDPDLGSGIRIRDKHPGSATLLTNLECKVKKTKNTYQIPSIRVTSSGFEYRTIFFSENCLGMLLALSCKNLRLFGA